MSGATSEPERSSSSRKEVSGRTSGREHNQGIFGAATAESCLPASSQGGSPVCVCVTGGVGCAGGVRERMLC